MVYQDGLIQAELVPDTLITERVDLCVAVIIARLLLGRRKRESQLVSFV